MGVKNIYKYRWIMGLLLFLACVLLEIHGSSIGYYSSLLHTPDINVLGKSRPIRSDEWLVNTPFAFSQYYNHFGYFSEVVRGYSTDMFMIYGQPILDWPVIFRPFHWGYLFLEPSKGLSFFWMGRWIFLFLVSFEFGMLIFERNKHLSLAYAFSLAFAPIIQWWFAVNSIAEIFIFGQGGVIIFNSYIETFNYRLRFLYGIILGWIAGVYALSVYPAWQVPCAYIFLSITGWILYSKIDGIHFAKKDALILGIVGTILAASMTSIFLKSFETINIVKNTIYPGTRLCLGGDFNLQAFLKSVFNYAWGLWLPAKNLSLETNNCEAARMMDLAPLGFILTIFYFIRQNKYDGLLLVLLGLQLFSVAWLLISWPTAFAKLTLFSNVTGGRFILCFGFINLLLLFRVMAIRTFEIPQSQKIFLALLGSAFGTYIAYSFHPLGFNYKYIIATAIIIFALWYLAMQKSFKIFTIFMIAILLFSGSRVNPIARGVDSIYKSAAVIKIQEIARTDEGLWAVACNGDNVAFNNIPIMAGARTINSVNTYPVLQRWYSLDKDEKHENTYNRYAHITVNLTSDTTNFKLVSPDHFTVSVTSDDLKMLNVKHIFSYGPINNIFNEEFKLEQIFRENDIYIYNVRY